MSSRTSAGVKTSPARNMNVGKSGSSSRGAKQTVKVSFRKK